MLHASVRAIGWIVGGPDVLIECLQDRLGPAGTLMMYAAWEERPEHYNQWSAEHQRAFLHECPPFDPARSRANRKWSILTEYLRTWPGARRSANPGASMVAVGAQADWITADHPLQYGYGPDSPLGKLCDAGGHVLQVGVSPGTATVIHLAEHLASIPNKRKFRYPAPVKRGPRTEWVEIEEYDTGDTVVESPEDYFDLIATEFRRTGQGTQGTIGHAEACLFRAAALRDYAVRWLEAHFAG